MPAAISSNVSSALAASATTRADLSIEPMLATIAGGG